MKFIDDAKTAWQLNHASNMRDSFSFQIGFMGQFWSIKSTQINAFAIDFYLSAPAIAVWNHAKKSTTVARSSLAHILRIFGFIGQAEINPAIVRANSIDMVNKRRPHAFHVEPREAVAQISSVINTDLDVSDCVASIRNSASLFSRSFNAPRENPSFWVVVKKFAQPLRGKIGFSHDALQLLIGQKPACVDSTCGLRYFSRMGAI